MKFVHKTKTVSLKYFDITLVLAILLSLVMIFAFISHQQRHAANLVVPVIRAHFDRHHLATIEQEQLLALLMTSHSIVDISVGNFNVTQHTITNNQFNVWLTRAVILPVALNEEKAVFTVRFVHPIYIMFSTITVPFILGLLLLGFVLLRKRLESQLNRYLLPLSALLKWSDKTMNQHQKQFQNKYIIRKEHHVFDYIEALEAELFSAQQEKNLFDQELREKVLLDPTTGIGTQDFFKSHLAALLEEEDSRGAVFLIQLKGCELVQNLYGETQAINVLEMVIDSIKGRISHIPDSFLSRRGEFELALLIPDLYVDDMERLAERLLKNLMTLSLPVGINHDEFCHMGISYFKNGDKLYQILSEADMALRSAQLQGPSQWFMYDPGEIANETAIGSLKWRTFLTRVINNKSIALFSQPVISSEQHQILSYEILSKILNSRGEYISPRVFLPMAEKCGLSLSLDCIVFELVCEKIIEDDYSIIYSINFSLDALLSETFKEKVLETLTQNPKLAEYLILEISEYHLKTRQSELLPTLHVFKQQGLALLADKVGQYVENAKYLKECQISYVKLHRSIVLDIDKKPENQVFIQSLKVLCDSLDIQVFSVGVENVDEWLALRKMHIDGGQGHYFDEPIPQISNN